MLKHRATESATPSYYYYALNSRNDVVGLYDANGAVCAKYTYDPWGNITSVTNASGTAITDTNNIAHTQPFRYRSYYYDTDSKFYYLQSRYYDPLTHRFINADGLVSTGTGVLGHNMFAYCDNNPVNYSDPTGCCGNPTCVSCNPERKAFVDKRTKKGWYDSVYPDFVPYSCKPTYSSSTIQTQQKDYANYTTTKVNTSYANLPDGGYASLTTTFDLYENDNGINYVAIRNLSYSVNNSISWDYVEIKYGNSYHVESDISYESYGTYIVKWAPSNDFVAIGSNMTVHMKDGKSINISNNYSEGEFSY